jgi:nucleotide-binding universal stress UspA family protein
MFKNVLVGVDGGSGGRDAIALASRVIDPAGTLTLVHVHSGELHALRGPSPAALREERVASERPLDEERSAAEVSAELVSVVASSAGRGLHQRAEDQAGDLIVVGSCSRGAVGRAMLGDDTRAALNGAPCAVAIAARGYADKQSPIARIGVGYDESPESLLALARARELAQAASASVEALEVLSIPTYGYVGVVPPVTGESVEALMKDANERLAALEGVDGHAVYGLTGEELAEFGGSLDLLVIGSRNYGPVRRLVLGSTANYLERHARCSLLVLPRGAKGVAEIEPAGHELAGAART